MASWERDAVITSPLLGRTVDQFQLRESHIAIDDASQTPLPLPSRPRQGVNFDVPRRLAALLAELRPVHALFLAALSILESITVAQGII